MKTKQRLNMAFCLLVSLGVTLGQPVIDTQPSSLTNSTGATATFSVTATGTPPLAYQWLFNSGSPLPGGTNQELILTNVQSFNGGGYSVIVTNVEGAATSVVAKLTVLTPPALTRQPANQTASLFADATFRVIANGDAPLSYQWRLNDADLIGMTNTSLTVTNVRRLDAGNYNVIVSNLSGSVTSQVATLTIVPFNSIYCFGFSWTGTSGLAPDGSSCGWNFPQYYQHRACNGPMWPEFLSTNLGLAYVQANNFGQCGATSSDILNQVISYRAPSKPNLSLYCLWADGPDVDFTTMVNALTNEAAGNRLLQTTLLNISNSVNRLYIKGARAIFIEWSSAGTWPSAGPRREWYLTLFGTNSALLTKNNEYEARFSAGFLDTINSYSQTRPDLRILLLNVFSKINNVLANPVQYGFTKTTISALDDQTLTDKSFSGPGADYVYWDGHGTSKLHKLIAAWHVESLTNAILETLGMRVANGLSNVEMNRLQIGRDYTLQRSSDLAQWNDIQTFTAAAATNQWMGALDDEVAAFYRLTWRRQ